MASILNAYLSADELLQSQALINIHHDLQIEQRETEADFHLSNNEAIYRLVKVACWQLGFINKDAEVIALAWSKKIKSLTQFNPHDWPSDLLDFDIDLQFSTAFLSCPKNLGLYVVAPSALWVERLAKAGVQTIQLRFKSDQTELIEAEIKQAIDCVKNYSCHLFINDHWQLAINYQAYGVHLGQEDLTSADLLAIAQSGLRLGISSHGYAEMLRAISYQPSYIALGAIFPTTLKLMETAPQGLGRLRRYAQLLRDYALVGIGGVDENNMTQVISSGVGSVAVVRAVIQSDDYPASIQKLQSYFKIN